MLHFRSSAVASDKQMVDRTCGYRTAEYLVETRFNGSEIEIAGKWTPSFIAAVCAKLNRSTITSVTPVNLAVPPVTFIRSAIVGWTFPISPAASL
jgi:hypothetical protein